jgi:hypothetical protein
MKYQVSDHSDIIQKVVVEGVEHLLTKAKEASIDRNDNSIFERIMTQIRESNGEEKLNAIRV